AGSRYNANGVDLNRNWGGPGSGQNPFSQPETAAMRDLLEAQTNIRAHVDLHSYGYMILWPWGHTCVLAIDNGTFDLVGDAMAEEILAVNGTEYPLRGPVCSTIYPVNGGSVDYSYGDLGLWAYGFEIGYNCYMPPPEIVPMSQDMLAALGYLSSWVLDCDDDGISNTQAIANGTSQDANQNGIPDECEALLIVSSEPPDGAIDGRQPSQPDGSDVAGWDSLFLTFTGNTEALGPEDFTITTDPPGQAPSVTDVTALDGGAVLQFNQIIPLTAWTMVTHEASGSNVRIGYLPADANNDRISNASDVLFVIDVLNGVVDPAPAAYQTDSDRSGATNASDVLRVIDLLNGAGEYDVWLGASLPE
ncbi:MAG: hypothetical protein IID36_10290, partial [Planctomycetes bacterium]|nr:hypothetical protein [Planctomycetota bacterium]